MPWIHLRHLPAPRYLHLRSVRGSLRSTPAATAQHPTGQARAREPSSRFTPAAEARPCPCTEAILRRPSSRSLSAPQPASSGNLRPARRLGQPAAPLLQLYLSGLTAREGIGRAAVRTYLRPPSRRPSRHRSFLRQESAGYAAWTPSAGRAGTPVAPLRLRLSAAGSPGTQPAARATADRGARGPRVLREDRGLGAARGETVPTTDRHVSVSFSFLLSTPSAPFHRTPLSLPPSLSLSFCGGGRKDAGVGSEVGPAR